jgi:hypothetical protein
LREKLERILPRVARGKLKRNKALLFSFFDSLVSFGGDAVL